MRVLMLGWDFSPRLSGGVGSACRGLANALARAPEPIGVEVLFVLPRLRGDEEPERVTLLAGDRPPEAPTQRLLAPAPAPARLSASRALPSAPRSGATRAEKTTTGTMLAEPEPSATPTPTPFAAEAPEHEPARETATSESEPAGKPPLLPSPSEALRLLEIDSPLRPYLSPADYAETVRGLLARIQRAATPPPEVRRPGTAPAPPARARRATEPPPTPPAVRLAEPPRAPDAPAVPPTAPEARPEPPARVPPYGLTLQAEVERYARAVLALVQGESFDVIHAHDWMTFPAGLLLQERTKKPLVLHFHSSESERRGAQAVPEVRAIEQAAIDAAERVLCVSEASARVLRAGYGIQYAKLRVLHNAYSPLDSSPEADERAAPVVLYLGRLSEQKSPDVFLRAAVPVVARHPRARFVLAGEGELYPELKTLAKTLGIARNVHFTGFVAGEELARTYAGADVYVLSSAAEPFGISALEALSLGIPTIVPDGAGVSEVVRSVLRFEPGDADELAEKIVALIERPALSRHLSASGLREVAKLRWDRPARALRGIYDEVVRTPS